MKSSGVKTKVNKKKKLENLQKRRLAFLEETVKFYSQDPKKLRNVDDNGICYYAPRNKSPGCAIGRHLNVKVAKKLDKDGGGQVDIVKDWLPQKLKNLGLDFLQEVQRFHDCYRYWNNHGLSGMGEIELEDIKKLYCGSK